MMFCKEKASARLKELRVKNGFSQKDMGQKLSRIMKSVNGKGMVLDGVNGKQTVSQLERGARGITIDIAFAYAEIFNVSLDFVFGRSDDWQPENKSVKDMTGLSDAAINVLQASSNKETSDFLNTLITYRFFSQIVGDYHNYNEIVNNPDDYFFREEAYIKAVEKIENPVTFDRINAQSYILFKCQKEFTDFVENAAYGIGEAGDDGNKN